MSLISNSTSRAGLLTGVLAVSALQAGAETPSESAPPVVLDPVQVRGERAAESFVPTDVASVGKLGVASDETPLAISVIDASVIESQAARSVPDVLRNVAGFAESTSRRGFDDFYLRGFYATGGIYQDGLLNRGSYVKLEPSSAERVEVLKGPASVLYGQAAPGGVVNIVSKRPEPAAFTELSVGAGSFDLREAALDFNRPLNDAVGVRLHGVVRERDDYTDYVYNERAQISPSVAWKVSDATRVTVLLQATRDEWVRNPGLPAEGTILPNPNGPLSPRLYVGEPGEDRTLVDHEKVGAVVEHDLTPDWTLSANLRWQHMDTDQIAALPLGSSLSAGQTTLNRLFLGTRIDSQEFQTDIRLRGTFSTGVIEHVAMGGVDYSFLRAEQQNRRAFLPINVYNPDYSGTVALGPVDYDNLSRPEQLGFYAQDHLTINKRLHVLLGLRHDRARAYENDRFTGVTRQTSKALTGNVGVLYEVTPHLAPYASYSESFTPLTALDGTPRPGVTFEPERGRQYEVGIKTQHFDERWKNTLSGFELTRENVLTSDPTDPTDTFSVQSGENRVRGLEWESVFQLSGAWDLIAAGALLDTEITSSNTGQAGNRLGEIPRKTLSLWSTYTFQSGALRNFGVGLGGRYVGSRSGSDDNDFDLPSYVVADASVFYHGEQWRARVNFKNLADHHYYSSASSLNRIYAGEPFTVSASVGYRF